ncbi:MAG: DUF2155 domain-containing protein [Alphaproteobacteria bacterium]|nr:DUF2155 domain-containing protein [Alphaproteobacteria bacterium]
MIRASFGTLIILILAFLVLPVSAAEMIETPIVRLRALEKITARTVTFEAEVGKTIRFGSIYIKTQACRKTSPLEQPEAASFLQIWEDAKPDSPDPKLRESHWVFSGWMFASSPSLSAMDHPIYDVWVLDCLEAKTTEAGPDSQQNERPGEGELKEGEIPQSPEIQRDILSP